MPETDGAQPEAIYEPQRVKVAWADACRLGVLATEYHDPEMPTTSFLKTVLAWRKEGLIGPERRAEAVAVEAASMLCRQAEAEHRVIDGAVPKLYQIAKKIRDADRTRS